MASPHTKLEESAGGIRCVAVSDVGMRRASNQDSLAIALADSTERWQSHGHLLLVADGMGAHAAGELASQIATDTIPHSYQKQPSDSLSEAIVAAVRAANDAIYNKGQNTVDFQGMGTTCSALVIMPSGAVAAHVGDSRIYRLRCEQFEQLTFDHSLVWEMAAAGHATEEEVPAYVPKNVITRSLGPHPTVAVDVEGPFPVESGDRFLLCSDGLTGPLKPELIGMVLGSLPLNEVAQTLVDLANLLGGPDNITVVVAEVVDAKQLGSAALVESGVVPKKRASKPRATSNSWEPWLSVTFGLSVLVCIGLIVQHDYLPAAICGVLGFGIWALKMGWGGGPSCPPTAPKEISMQGKAPYRQHACKPSATSIETLSDIVRQLEDLEHQREWKFDWKEIQSERQHAHEAIAKGDYSQAVVSYCSAVRRLMHSLRETRQDKPSDSTIDLG